MDLFAELNNPEQILATAYSGGRTADFYLKMLDPGFETKKVKSVFRLLRHRPLPLTGFS